MIRLKNTLSGKKEEFKSVRTGKVGMYTCGPTVYDYPHLGNLRKYVFDDIVRRTLESNGFQVDQVMNITDIGHLTGDGDEGEDKMTRALKREGKPLTLETMKELGDFYAQKFKEDLKKLNILTPTHMPVASDHVAEDIALIEDLDTKGFAYATSDGVYFDTGKDPSYGKLGGLTDTTEEVSRIGLNREKKNSRDFALWKFNDKLGWKSPWGKGFPGWHIECSALALAYLGNGFQGKKFTPTAATTVDIHTGGIDHIAVHHNNEIAQSEAATGKKFVNYWLHENFLNIADTKISKSLGNTIILNDLEEKGFSPLAYRYWLLTAHYSSPVNFTWEAMTGAQKTYDRLADFMKTTLEKTEAADQSYVHRFNETVSDDIDTPRAIAVMWEMMKDSNLSAATKKATLLLCDRVLGLGLADISIKKVSIPKDVANLIAEREQARKDKDWKKADELRIAINEAGFDIQDSDTGPITSKIRPIR